MDASNENCRKAIDNLKTQERFMNEYAFKILSEFLAAAEKRLPSQEAIDADNARRKTPAEAAREGFDTLHTDSGREPPKRG
jgi:hypothetical protein